MQDGTGKSASEDVAVVKAQKKLLKKQRKAAAAQAEVRSAVQTVKEARLTASTASQQQPSLASSSDSVHLTDPSLQKRKKPKASDKTAAEVAVSLADAADEVVPRQATNPVKHKKHKAGAKLIDKATDKSAAAGSRAASVQIVDAVRPSAGQKPGSAQEQPAAKKRRVRFAMKRNLLMQIGGAVPPQEVRTPPGSRPKVTLVQNQVCSV